MSASRIAVVGGRAELAGEIVDLLLARGIDAARIRVLGGEDTAGEILERGALRLRVEPATAEAMAGFEHALFAGDAGLAARLIPVLRAAGGVAIDATAHSRAAAAVPLIVPEVNGARVRRVPRGAVLACPSPAALALAVVLAPLHRAATVRRVVTTVFEPASERGEEAIEDLSRQSVRLMQGLGIDREESPEQVAFNLRVARPGPDGEGWAARERSLAREVSVLLGEAALEIAATVVRVPVFHGAAQAVTVDLERALDIEEARGAIRETQGLLLAGSVEDRLAVQIEAARRRRAAARLELEAGVEAGEDEDEAQGGQREPAEVVGRGDDGAAEDGAELEPDLAPGPVDVAGSELVHVARLRIDAQRPASLALWLTFDDERRGVVLSLVSVLDLALAVG